MSTRHAFLPQEVILHGGHEPEGDLENIIISAYRQDSNEISTAFHVTYVLVVRKHLWIRDQILKSQMKKMYLCFMRMTHAISNIYILNSFWMNICNIQKDHSFGLTNYDRSDVSYKRL